MSPEAPFKVTQPFDGIYHVEFPLRPGLVGEVDMAFHFLRFQEHYEGPGFRGTAFTWARYVAWYRAARGTFSYPWDWSGFNFPGSALVAFRQGAFDPLTKREQGLLQALAPVQSRDYVIGTQGADAGALKHELAHAFWHMDPEYRARVQAVLAGGDYRVQEAALAEGDGYDPSVFTDEIQACAVSGAAVYAPDPARRSAIRRLFETRRRQAKAC